MAFRNFRSGTLERSIRRWGPRMPTARKFKRKQHSWIYIRDGDNSLSRSGDSDHFILFNNVDWDPTGQGGGVNCRNVSIDLRHTVVWTPVTSTTPNFNSLSFIWGLWSLDEDDVQAQDLTFGESRALAWDEYALNYKSNTNGSENADALDVMIRRMTWRTRVRQRFMKFDDDIRYICRFNEDVTGVFTDARIFFMARISWEIP